MKKLAVFVEGQTEQVFIERLITQVANRRQLRVATYRATGGRVRSRQFEPVSVPPHTSEHKFYVQIIDCGGEERVASDVRDQYESLVTDGFAGIIGIRDVRPNFTPEQIPPLRAGLRFRIKTNPVNPLFVLGVMEVEAWFLAEHHHFEKIDPGLTCDRIQTECGFDPRTDDVQARPCPHQDLHDIYQLAGKAYHKSATHVQRTVDALDYEYIFCEMPDRFKPDLEAFVAALDQFFTPP